MTAAASRAYDELVDRVRELAGDLDRPPVVGIAGHGGAGKTTLARLRYATRGYDGEEGEVDLAMPPVVVLEGIRVIRPETRPLLDLAVWIDLDPVTAGERAKARNVLQGDSREELDLWDTTWVPEGRDYQRRVRPEPLADIVLPADASQLV